MRLAGRSIRTPRTGVASISCVISGHAGAFAFAFAAATSVSALSATTGFTSRASWSHPCGASAIPAANRMSAPSGFYRPASVKKGLVRRSVPKSLPGPWPQMNCMSSPKGSNLSVMAVIRAAWSP